MTTYKGFNIYSSYIVNHGFVWRIQSGYEWLGDYKTIGAAKSAITQKWLA